MEAQNPQSKTQPFELLEFNVSSKICCRNRASFGRDHFALSNSRF